MPRRRISDEEFKTLVNKDPEYIWKTIRRSRRRTQAIVGRITRSPLAYTTIGTWLRESKALLSVEQARSIVSVQKEWGADWHIYHAVYPYVYQPGALDDQKDSIGSCYYGRGVQHGHYGNLGRRYYRIWFGSQFYQ